MRVVGKPTRRDLIVGLSLANLCFLRVWSLLFAYDEPFAFYLAIARSDLLAAMINVTLLGLAFALAAAAARRFGKLGEAATSVALAFVVLLILNEWRRFRMPGDVAAKLKWLIGQGAHLHSAALLAIGMLLILALAWRWHHEITKVIVVILILLSPFVVITFGRAAWAAATFPFAASFSDQPSAVSVSASGATRLQRVVLVIFDEMDYRLAFEERPPELLLPEFDRLRTQSFFALNADPPATGTLLSLTSYTTGGQVISAEPVDARTLRLEFADGSRRVWGSDSTLFSRGRDLGANVAVIGFHLPYCRVLSSVLMQCSDDSMFLDGTAGVTDKPGVLHAMAKQSTYILPWSGSMIIRRLYRRTLRRSQDVVRDARVQLAFLHLPVPHPPTVYNRKTERFSVFRVTPSGYLDNLALADKTLTDLRYTMEKGGTWEISNIIVTSDHAWRYSAGYDGKMDERVPLLVKLSGRNEPVEYSSRMNTLLVTELSLALLRREIASPHELAEWMSRATKAGAGNAAN